MEITVGSLFDGIGGWCIAAERNGAVPVWSSEIEPFCIEVTKKTLSERHATWRHQKNKR